MQRSDNNKDNVIKLGDLVWIADRVGELIKYDLGREDGLRLLGAVIHITNFGYLVRIGGCEYWFLDDEVKKI